MPKVRLPSPLVKTLELKEDIVSCNGQTIGEVLNDLCKTHPKAESRIFRDGAINRYLNVYVNDEDIRFMDNLDTVVEEKDEITLIQAVAGG